MDFIDELEQEEITVDQFINELRDIKGYTSITYGMNDEYLPDHNRTFFYDDCILEYQVGTNRVVKVMVDGSLFKVKKDGVVYEGEKAKALFKDDKEFKKWKKTCDGDKNALIQDACAKIFVYHVNYVYAFKELILPKDYSFCTIRELMSFIKSREFESVQARHLPMKDKA